MPTYEYECRSCGQRVEVFQRLAEEPLTTCRRCGGRLRKLFHPVGIAFRGSGFYTTDSRSGNGAKKKAPAEKPAKESTDAPKKDSGGSSSTKRSSSSAPKDGSERPAPA